MVVSPKAMITTTYAGQPIPYINQSRITSKKLNVQGRVEGREVGKMRWEDGDGKP